MLIGAATSSRVQRLRRAPAWAIDALLGTLVVGVGLLTAAGGRADPAALYRKRDAFGIALVLLATLPYYARRRVPLAVFLTSVAALGALMLRDYDPGALPWVLLLGAYTVAAYRPSRELVAAALFMAATLIVLLVDHTAEFGTAGALSSGIAFGGAMVLGRSAQARRQRIVAFGREQAETELRAAADERLRIAQELHDVVAHSLGVIAVQAGVGMHVIESDPAEARRSLEHISRTSRSSLAEIRRLLGMVRNAEGASGYTPAPGLDDLPRLVDEMASAGLAVDLRVEGSLENLPAGLGLAAYRIVQEALTNALRHAAASRAEVRLTNASGTLSIDVSDDGRGANGSAGTTSAAPSMGGHATGGHTTGGHGLVGMRERVAMYGGTLDTGPGPNGGFRVAARLRYDDERIT